MYKNVKKMDLLYRINFHHYYVAVLSYKSTGFLALRILLLVTVTCLKMSTGVKDSSGTFTYPLCPMQGVISDL